MRVCAWASAKNGGVRRRTVISGAALALAGSALAAAPAAVAGPVRICDGQRAVIAKGIGCAAAFWLADHARAGEQIAGWSVRGNSAGVVRLRRGKAWVKLRRVPRESIAALLIAGLSVEHVQPYTPTSHGFESVELCADGRMSLYAESGGGTAPDDPGPASAISAASWTRGTWEPAYVVEWRGGRTVEFHARAGGGFGATGGIVLAASERVRLELRDDGTGTLRATGGAWPVTWKRGAACRV